MAIALVSSSVGKGTANPAVVAYPASIAAGDLILLTLFAQGSISPNPPSGFTLVGAGTSVAGIDMYFCWKSAAGTESGTNLSVPFSGANNWMFVISRITGGTPFTAGSFKNYSTTSSGSLGSNIAAPNQGAVGAGEMAWAAAGAYNGTNATESGSGSGWTFRNVQNQGSPNETSFTAESTTATGAATFNFGANYAGRIAGSFIIQEVTASVGYPLLMAM